MMALHQGRFDDAERLAIENRNMGLRFSPDHAEGVFGVQMFSLHREQGRLASSCRCCGTSSPPCPGPPPGGRPWR
jgi:hypothetical protein